VKSHVTKSFNAIYANLPPDVQQLADEAYALFKQDPHHPSLQFKRLKGRQTYSVRIGLHWRALAFEQNGELYWYWIGSHAEYDKLV
jgi:hypothetical protein